MGCCGQKRAALIAASRTAPAPGARSDRAPAPGPAPAVSLRYVGGRPVSVRGIASGHVYSFSRTAPLQPVNAADAPALLRTGQFMRI